MLGARSATPWMAEGEQYRSNCRANAAIVRGIVEGDEFLAGECRIQGEGEKGETGD